MKKFKNPKVITKKLSYEQKETYFAESSEKPGFKFVDDLSQAKLFYNSDPVRWALQRLNPYYSYLKGISIKEKVGKELIKVHLR